ncbi:MAG TPA: DotU family type IV/VI secretion system protein [Bryobacteraceae bacterium]|nr:DotU family type IV/VI secretion system protein [Bryobacteraceae bacterium]
MTPSVAARSTENLALILQEALTAIVRLRSNRQAVSDANSFRTHMKEALKAADQEGRKRGYNADTIKFAVFAVVAFLDESILNSRNPLFADWPRKPLQEELFGTHMAGEVYFQNLQKLLGQTDSPELADLLEVYYLCILLGFAGRYSVGNKGDLRGILDATGEKIWRVRGRLPDLSPSWRLPQEAARKVGGDPWSRNLGIAAIACFVLVVVLFFIFNSSLGSGISDLRVMAIQGH